MKGSSGGSGARQLFTAVGFNSQSALNFSISVSYLPLTLHTLTLLACSLCIVLCVLSCPTCRKPSPHISHLCGNSPVCSNKCCLKFCLDDSTFRHVWQRNWLNPGCE